MIERYTGPEMAKIWSQENKFNTWLKVELLACEKMAELGIIPKKDLALIKRKAGFDVKRIDEIEKTVNHDVIAFLTSLSEHVGPASRHIHYGMTSSDVLDTSLSLLMRDAADLLLDRMGVLLNETKKKALKYKFTPMVGRSHGVHAEPVTFGLKMGLMFTELKRVKKRLKASKDVISIVKISGAVGTHAHLPASVESYVAKKLGMEPAAISTQIIQRDRHADFLNSIALAGAVLEKWALEIRNLQRTEIYEVEEYFAKGQKGSSAMPHKRNPITCERICGLARILRGNAVAGLENVALWHERDITHSSAERIIIPDSAILLDYMLSLMVKVIGNLNVYPGNMVKNILKTKGLVFSQRIMLELTRRGVSREKAYKIVQRNAMEVWKTGRDFKDLLLNDKELKALMNAGEIEKCFDLKYYFKDVNRMFKSAGITGR
ncbi:MAG: adenylosuccinate lyase [bacterium]|nr:adenylosuccinate lyase [bacterium]